MEYGTVHELATAVSINVENMAAMTFDWERDEQADIILATLEEIASRTR